MCDFIVSPACALLREMCDFVKRVICFEFQTIDGSILVIIGEFPHSMGANL